MVQNDDIHRIFAYDEDDEELKYINDFFGDIESEKPKKNTLANENKLNKLEEPKEQYRPITITKKERMVLVQSIRYNDSFVMPFVSDELTTASLSKKGFIEENREKEKVNVPYKVKDNVSLLFQIEGLGVFDEIVV